MCTPVFQDSDFLRLPEQERDGPAPCGEVQRLRQCGMCGCSGSATNPFGYSIAGWPFMGMQCCHWRFKFQPEDRVFLHWMPPGRQCSPMVVWGPVQVLALRLLHHFASHHLFGFAPVVQIIAEFNAPKSRFAIPSIPSLAGGSPSSDDLEAYLEEEEENNMLM